MTAETVPVPAEETGRPYPDDPWPEITARYAGMAARREAELDAWLAGARERVFDFPQPGAVPPALSVVPEPLPELPAAILPAAGKPRHRWRDLMRKRPERPEQEPRDDHAADALGDAVADMDGQIAAMPARGRHAKPEDVRRDGLGAQGEPATGTPMDLPRANTVPPPHDVPRSGQDAEPITGGLITGPGHPPPDEAKQAEIQRQAQESLRRAGVKDEDFADLHRPHDATEVIPRAEAAGS